MLLSFSAENPQYGCRLPDVRQAATPVVLVEVDEHAPVGRDAHCVRPRVEEARLDARRGREFEVRVRKLEAGCVREGRRLLMDCVLVALPHVGLGGADEDVDAVHGDRAEALVWEERELDLAEERLPELQRRRAEHGVGAAGEDAAPNQPLGLGTD